MYDDYFQIIEPFYKKYKQKILEARLLDSAYNRFVKHDVKYELNHINDLVKQASKLCGTFGIDKSSKEYQDLVKKSQNLIEELNNDYI